MVSRPEASSLRGGHPPALAVSARGAVVVGWDGAVQELGHGGAAALARATPPLLCHALDVAARLGVERFPARDLLELFAFVRPARFCLPTPRGLSEALGLPAPRTVEDEARTLHAAASALLDELADAAPLLGEDVKRLVRAMDRGGWTWGADVMEALGLPREGAKQGPTTGLDVWKHLPEWEDEPPAPPPGSQAVEPREARRRLGELVGRGRDTPEARPQQSDYASAVSAAFAPREREDEPNVVLAEAGTGVGKTLGYLAPASLWAERNGAPVWVATYTRNLQRQIDQEAERLFPDPAERRRRVVIRKGRENYLCLLNYQEAVGRTAMQPGNAIGLGLLARWLLATRDGDLVGGDLPSWLLQLIGRGRTTGLADRRGECIYSSCEHWKRCFIERTVRRARSADIVIANHALTMIQAATGGLDDAHRPLRYVFDEGHHLFDAADGAFAAHLSAVETSEMRRWLLGAEGGRSSRARGLERRVGDLVSEDQQAESALRALMAMARELPSFSWASRLEDGTALGPAETFFALLRQQVLARAAEPSAYGQECDVRPLGRGVAGAAREFARTLERMLHPAGLLRRALLDRLDREAATLETGTRSRIEGVVRSLQNRCELSLRAWADMLRTLKDPGAVVDDDEGEEPAPEEDSARLELVDTQFVDWFAIERNDGRETDVGMYRHYLDPTAPFVEAVLKPAHGAAITSATLRDLGGVGAPGKVAANDDPLASEAAAWTSAELRTGTRHLPAPAIRAQHASPFDYPARTRVFIVRDVARDDADQVAAAYRELFLAADGGGLGLFTAIGRLRAAHQRIAASLEAAGIPLYAQHIGGMDPATLVEIFRAEERSCLLGTDAVRDGVDVPGRSLRLIVFDRVPWPRPDILHRARKTAYEAAGWPRTAYDDMLTRFRLKQAFGRLIRRADDRGAFVMLDGRLPSRLLPAFPAGVPIRRVGLAEAVAEVRAFLGEAG